MNQLIKRRKDEGFTLIELMIVIAVIGILAIVLVPKVGSIKTQAKDTGLDTNIRLVEGYVQSKITKWADKGTDAEAIQDDIVAAFNFTSDSDKFANPFTLSKTIGTAAGDNALIVLTEEDDLTNKGVVVVQVDESDYTITITAHDNIDGAIITDKTVTITP